MHKHYRFFVSSSFTFLIWLKANINVTTNDVNIMLNETPTTIPIALPSGKAYNVK